MSIPNEAQNPKEKTDYLTINESGEVIIRDPNLAEMVQELSDEELGEIAGGVGDINIPCNHTNNSQCACPRQAPTGVADVVGVVDVVEQ